MVAISFASLVTPVAARTDFIVPMLKLGGNFCPLAVVPADRRGGIQTANATANSTTASGNALGVSSDNGFVSGAAPADNLMDRTMVQLGTAGNFVPVTNRPPYPMLLNCIAIEGIILARN